MGPRTSYLHVGQGKTGTTFVQAAFGKAADALAREGVLYPDLRRQGDAVEGDWRNWRRLGGNGVVFMRGEVKD